MAESRKKAESSVDVLSDRLFGEIGAEAIEAMENCARGILKFNTDLISEALHNSIVKIMGKRYILELDHQHKIRLCVKIAHDESIDLIRKSSVRQSKTGSQMPNEPRSIPKNPVDVFKLDKTIDQLNKLSATEKKIVLLRAVAECTFKEIGIELNMSTEKAARVYYSCVEKIKSGVINS